MNFQELYDAATPAEQAEFRRRQRVCLQISVVIKIAIIMVIIYLL